MINFDKLEFYKSDKGTFIDARSLEILNKLNDDDAISMEEISKLLGTSATRARQLLKNSSKEYAQGTWHIDLFQLRKKSFKSTFTQYVYRKGDMAEILKFKEYRDIKSEIIKNKRAYRKAMRVKYGLENFTYSSCSKANFNCAKCLNKTACDIANNKPFIKRLTVIMRMLEKMDYIPMPLQIQDIEQENAKLREKNTKLELQISELQIMLLKARQELLKTTFGMS